MDVESYDTLFVRTKESLQNNVRRSFNATQFSVALEECNTCISQGLELVKDLLDRTNVQVNELCGYLENVITLLQMLSDFIKNIIETTTMSCCNMQRFPTTTGNIILTVFLHCKDSECIYGNHLKLVETQLKDLFRTCHELQLTYLMTLEKHFIFDLTEKEEQEIIIEALNINMRIGDIVQALDVKTMAEQWKAYTVICEKYSNFLLDKNIYNKCTQLFASIIKDHIKTAMENEQDNKNMLRSLKIANFTIKILSRLSNIFKHAATNNYDYVVEFLEYIYMHNPAYLDLSAAKSQQFVNLVVTNVLNPTEILCDILLQDERFYDYINKINVIKDLDASTFLGHIILIISLMKATMNKKENEILNLAKCKIINCIYRILPIGHYWFNMGLKFQIKEYAGCVKYFSLYEHLLVHTVAFASTFNSEQYALLEKYMYEAILSTDCYSAMFSSNLWVLIIRNNNQLVLNTLQSLQRIYQELEKLASFHISPQEIHLKYTVRKFFEILSPEYKILVSKQLTPQSSLWCAVRVSDLPDHLRRNYEAVIFENIKMGFEECFESSDVAEEEINNLIQTIKIASTCKFLENSVTLEQYLVKLWIHACHKNEYIESNSFSTTETLWHFIYLEALVALSESMEHGHRFSNSANSARVLHSMSTIMDSCNIEIILLLFDLFCSLSFNRIEDENQHIADSIFKDTLKMLLQGVGTPIKSYILNGLYKFRDYEQFQELASSMLCEDDLRNEWKMICKIKDKLHNTEWQEKMLQSVHYEFSHKCMVFTSYICRKPEKGNESIKSDFDLGDFMNEFDEPPVKKTKLSFNEADAIVERLENDTLLLSQIENVNISKVYNKRITNVINKLKNIVS